MDLRPLKSLDGWKFSKDAVDIRGWHLFDRDGKDIGIVDDLMMSLSVGEAIFALIKHDRKDKLVPLDRLSLDKDNKKVIFNGIVDHLNNSPDYSKDTHDYSAFYDHWGGLRSAPDYRKDYESREFRGYVVYPEEMEEE
jgi:sporulation protein YlmC with PRC-barrel domain